MPMVTCPKGHASSDPDFCDVCGVRIGAAPVLGGAAPAEAAGGEVCPDCGTPRQPGSRFCEMCRHDFQTGGAGLSPRSAAAAVAAAAPTPAAAELQARASDLAPGPAPAALGGTVIRNPWAVVLCDRSLLDPADATAFPENEPERSYPLDLDETVVGRRNPRHHTDVTLVDPAASARHLALSRRPDGGLYATDLNSSNGTKLNGKPLDAGVAARLAAGDALTLGAFTRITIASR